MPEIFFIEEFHKIIANDAKNKYNQSMKILSSSADETLSVAENFGKKLVGGDVVLLFGDLGAGKTTFTKGIAKALGVRDVVTSPTFTIVKEYEGDKLNLYHMDLYRVSGDTVDLGLEDYLERKDGVVVIEWNVLSDFSGRVFEVKIDYAGEGAREIEIKE